MRLRNVLGMGSRAEGETMKVQGDGFAAGAGAGVAGAGVTGLDAAGGAAGAATHIQACAAAAYPTRGSTSRAAATAAHPITSSDRMCATARRCDQLASAPSSAASAVTPIAPR